MKEFVYNSAYCINVIDGDTIDVDIDVGFDFSTVQRLRLEGIDTPERNEPGYGTAKQFVIDKHELIIINFGNLALFAIQAQIKSISSSVNPCAC